MSCTGESNLQGLKHPTKFKAIPNEREELAIIGWDIVKDEVERLTDLGWKYDERGKAKLALNSYRGANIYFYLIQYATIIRNYMDSVGGISNQCVSTNAEDKYNINCVEKNLPCLGKKHNTDYGLAWEQLTQAFGIDRQTGSCNECCLGIGEMILGGPDDCTSYIIGDCEENEVSGGGEFTPCEFNPVEFTQPIGPDPYGECNPPVILPNLNINVNFNL